MEVATVTGMCGQDPMQEPYVEKIGDHLAQLHDMRTRDLSVNPFEKKVIYFLKICVSFS